MPSPFPGMNPYLEQADAWVDFHSKFINALADWVNEKTGDDYFAKVEEQIYVHELPPERWRLLGRADVAVAPTADVNAAPGAGNLLAPPVTVQLVDPVDTVALPYVEVHDRAGRDVVTVIELLSPANKHPGPDRDQYARKRLRLFRSGVNFVEFDLLRGGPRHSFRDGPPTSDYYILVYRPAGWPHAGVWPVQLRERLPVVPIPLREGEADLALDVQDHLHSVYDRGKYRAYIYDGRPVPPLAPDDDAWAEQFLPPRTA